jgi:hypothetical protein
MDTEKTKLPKFHEHFNDQTRIRYFQDMRVWLHCQLDKVSRELTPVFIYFPETFLIMEKWD